MADSQITKNAIAESLKKLTKTKPFDKITVSDIASTCGINRQTFYYHFEDKYELLSWIYYKDAFAPIMDKITFDNWDSKLADLFAVMKDNQSFYTNTIKYTDDYFQEYIIKMAETIFEEVIDTLDEDRLLGSDDRTLFARFYAYGVYGTVNEWVVKGMKIPPSKLASYMKRLAVSTERVGYIRVTTGESQDMFPPIQALTNPDIQDPSQ